VKNVAEMVARDSREAKPRVETPTFFILGAQHRALINNRVAVQAAAKTPQKSPFPFFLPLSPSR